MSRSARGGNGARGAYEQGVEAIGRGARHEAVAALTRAVSLAPGLTDAHFRLVGLYAAAGRPDGAAAHAGRCLQLRPRDAAMAFRLGRNLFAEGAYAAAVTCYRQAVYLLPGEVAPLRGLAASLAQLGQIEAAAEAYRSAVALAPVDPLVRQGQLALLNQLEGRDPLEVAAAHRAWGELLERAAGPRNHHRNTPDPDRRLRVGYLSGAFRAHSISWFVAPLLRCHERREVEVRAYSSVAEPDATTERLRGLVDGWRDLRGLDDDDDIARLIEADGIDVLVDVHGVAARSHLGVFARRPAPVQATWLAYPNTTGLSTMGWRIVDELTDPPAADAWHSERLLRLEHPFLCYEPPADAPAVAALPARSAGHVTFASFNFPGKAGSSTLALWGQILQRTPDAKLLLKAQSFAEAAAVADYRAKLAAHGIDPGRVDMLPMVERTRDHLALYGRADIALDPFPYNGTTTTCEALWMGVPVVALRGDRHLSRVSASLLSTMGLEALLADDGEAYVAKAVELASDPNRLETLRHGLRQRMAASPLCDAPAFAAKMEAAYRRMWRAWCEEGEAS